jgi:pyruvate dehydrogenase E2 component (dihydrolipoamide acetyltransferase)
MIVERDIQAAAASGGTVKATPLAAKTAALAGVDLAGITGTGSHGKVTRADVDAVRALRAAGGTGERRIIPMRGRRKIIAERMKQSQNENAQTCHRVSVRMDEAVRLREALEKTVGYNDLIAMATVRALRDFPAATPSLPPKEFGRRIL